MRVHNPACQKSALILLPQKTSVGEVPEAQLPAPARGHQNGGVLTEQIHVRDLHVKKPSISYRTGDRRIVRSIQHAHNRTRCGVPQLHIHLEGSLPLFHPFQPGRSNDNLVILRPQAIAQFHLASTLWEVYSSSAPKIGTNITVQHNRRAHREVRRTAPHTRVALGLRCCDQLIARV